MGATAVPRTTTSRLPRLPRPYTVPLVTTLSTAAPASSSVGFDALAGRATAEGTARLARRFTTRRGADFYRPIADGVVASAVGLGTYLGDCDAGEDGRYERAARLAISLGVNALDTAINYRCQRSERALGRAVRAAVVEGAARRDELVVCTKGGFVAPDGAPPATREAYDAYLTREFFDAGVMGREDVVAGGHCLTPGYLRHQVAASRANLGLGTIDLYYLHNPEQQLETMPREQFVDVMRSAFEELEAQCASGDIAAYGCATWQGLRVLPASRHHLSLEALVGLAREVAGDAHHFRAVQLPLNLGMTEAVRQPTQTLDGRAVSLLEAAAALGLSVVASASLMQAQLARGLPLPLRDAFPGLDTDAQRAIAFVAGLPGVATALVGMRREEHVRENVAVFDTGRSGSGGLPNG
jgi:aryl-alcohol dehydrogenase-like predicted oxidoreductase